MSSSSSAKVAVLPTPAVPTAGRRARVLRGVNAQTAALSVIEGARGIAAPETPSQAAERGYAQGFDQGYQDGLAEGRAAMTAEVDAARSRLASAARALTAAAAECSRRQANDMTQLEDVVAGLAFEIAAAVVGREIDRSASPAADALARALALAPPSVPAVARFHPDDVAIMEMAVTLDRPVTIVPDAAIERGGCLVEAGDARIDAQVGPALDRVRLALLGDQTVATL